MEINIGELKPLKGIIVALKATYVALEAIFIAFNFNNHCP